MKGGPYHLETSPSNQWNVFYITKIFVMKELCVSHNFDAVRYVNNKILQVRWCSQQYLEFTHSFFRFLKIFSLLYLFNCKFVGLIIFSFYKHFRGFARLTALDRHRVCNFSKPGVNDCNNITLSTSNKMIIVIIVVSVHPIL